MQGFKEKEVRRILALGTNSNFLVVEEATDFLGNFLARKYAP